MPELESLKHRVVHLETEEELKVKLEKSHKTGRPLRIKLGIDASGPDIHLGFAVPLRKLRQFQDAGHIAVLIIGDFTGKIGDPSGRSKTRPQLTDAEIKANVKRYREQAFQILDPEKCEFRYNSEWSNPLTGPDIINIASRYTVARIIEREDFKTRLECGIPLHMHELLYPLFQGYDSVAVKSDVELGGQDQYWNLLVGRELQREFGQEPQVIMTMPILVGLDGTKKMSKSFGNYISISEPPKEMFGKLMSIPDRLIMDFFRLCTNRTDEELRTIEQRINARENPRNIKAELASDIVTIYYSAEAAKHAAQEFDRIFRHKGLPDQMPEFSLPSEGVNIIELIAQAGLLPSKSEARRKLREGAVYLDGERIKDIQLVVMPGSDSRILKVGKRRFLRLRNG